MLQVDARLLPAQGKSGNLLMPGVQSLISGTQELASATLVIARNELTLQTRYRTKFLLDLFSPALALAPIVLTAYFLTAGRESSYLAQTVQLPDHFTFILLGYMAFAALGVGNPIMHYTGPAWAVRMQQETGTLERNLLSPAPREALVLGTGLYYAVLYLFHLGCVLIVSLLLFDIQLTATPESIGVAVGLVFAMSLMSILLGFLMSSVSLVMRDGSVALLVIHRPFLLLTGAYFLIELLPQPFRFLAMVNPLAYAIDAFRGSLSSSTLLLPLEVECAIVALSTVLIGIVGVWTYRRVLDRQLRRGDLSLY